MNLRQFHAHKMATDPEYAAAVRANEGAQALADEIVARRCASGLTQEALAECAGITQPQLARLESGETNPTLETLTHVARALGSRLAFVPVLSDAPEPAGGQNG